MDVEGTPVGMPSRADSRAESRRSRAVNASTGAPNEGTDDEPTGLTTRETTETQVTRGTGEERRDTGEEKNPTPAARSRGSSPESRLVTPPGGGSPNETKRRVCSAVCKPILDGFLPGPEGALVMTSPEPGFFLRACVYVYRWTLVRAWDGEQHRIGQLTSMDHLLGG